MKNYILERTILLLQISLLICASCFANNELFQQAKKLQKEQEYNKAIDTYKRCIAQPVVSSNLTDEELFIYTESLVQLMNSYQMLGEPEACISTLRELYDTSAILQKQCKRDYYSVLGYALSRTENMKEAEETTLKALALPLHHPTPERYFRDYAYAAAVFYSNTDYHNEVLVWCEEALHQAELCKNTSGAQYVKAMLGSLYKRGGELSRALKLFTESTKEAELKGDDLGRLNSLNMLIDFFLYWDIPEYANIYATEAIKVERAMSAKNPMVSAQTYINKGRALSKLGKRDSVLIYTNEARNICSQLPYNSGMVDVNLLHGSTLAEMGDAYVALGIEELQQVTAQGTALNQAKAYHQLALTYLQYEQYDSAEQMLDSMYSLLNHDDTHIYIELDYEPILNHYLQTKNYAKVEQYARLMLNEQHAMREQRLNFNIVETIVDAQTAQVNQELVMTQLKQTNLRLKFSISVAVFVVIILAIVILLISQKRRYKSQIKAIDQQFAQLIEERNQSKIERESDSQEIKEILRDNDNRQKLETLTPFILKESGEIKFRQCFEILHPLFLHRLREKVPTITRREELLSMLIALKQDNKDIAELLSIAPRSVLMLRHRFRQKIGMASEYSLENFIEDILSVEDSSTTISEKTAQSKE